MTGGSLGPSYYEPAVALSTDQQPRYARLPDNAKQTLVKDTIYLTDPAFVLPTRSQVRRRAFQNLQNRYVSYCVWPWATAFDSSRMIQILPTNSVRVYKHPLRNANMLKPTKEGVQGPIPPIHRSERSHSGDRPCLGRSSRERSLSLSTSQFPGCLCPRKNPQGCEACAEGKGKV